VEAAVRDYDAKVSTHLEQSYNWLLRTPVLDAKHQAIPGAAVERDGREEVVRVGLLPRCRAGELFERLAYCATQPSKSAKVAPTRSNRMA